ncbi:bifunctional folylpolyglutamate synthase/dihydrofolate synthase [bacterium]|nr:bifunctional folylpolyglutamate synthase/dihydrofolate synthase [bacterium]
MDKQSTLDWLYSLHRFGIKPGLERINKLAEFLGHPERNFKSIHITGTNGKGSTASNLASMLIEGGYKTGLYTSPHVLEFNERIQLQSKMIDDEALVEYAQSLKPLQEKINATFFELTTAIAFRYFADMQTDIAIIEAGMGGMNDATNIISSVLAIITPISLEHTEYLGDTIEKIAFDKSQIIKPKSKSLISDKNKSLGNIFFKQANKVSSDLFFTNDLLTLKNIEINPDFSSRFEIIDCQHKTKSFSTPLIGKFQIENALMAIASTYLLKENFQLNDSIIQKGLENVVSNTHLSSRLEIISNNPLILLDSGHNPGAMKELVDSLAFINHSSTEHDNDQFVFLMALMTDKDAESIFSIISPLIKHLILTQPKTSRASNPLVLKNIASKFISDKSIEIIPEVPDALNKLIELNDSSIILGSFYLAEEVKRALPL